VRFVCGKEAAVTSSADNLCNVFVFEIYWVALKVAGSIPAGVIGFFIDIKSFRSHYGSGVDSASNSNECQEHFLGYRRPVRMADNVPPSCAVVTKSGNLNFWNPLGLFRPVMGLLCVYLCWVALSRKIATVFSEK